MTNSQHPPILLQHSDGGTQFTDYPSFQSPPRSWNLLGSCPVPSSANWRGSLHTWKGDHLTPVPGGNQAEGFEGGWNLAPHLPLFSGSWLLGPWVRAWPPSVTCDPGSSQARYLEAPKAVTGTIMSIWGWATLGGRALGRGGGASVQTRPCPLTASP